MNSIYRSTVEERDRFARDLCDMREELATARRRNSTLQTVERMLAERTIERDAAFELLRGIQEDHDQCTDTPFMFHPCTCPICTKTRKLLEDKKP